MGLASKATQTWKHSYIYTDAEPDCAEIGREWDNGVIITVAMIFAIDYSGKL